MAGYKMVEWDRERKLKFDFNALVDFEKVSGHTLADLDLGSAGFFIMQCLAWAGLNSGIPDSEPKLTLKQCGEILQAGFDAKKITLKTLGSDFGAAIKESGIFAEDPSEKNA
jgi:hypothetical protein